MVLLTCWIDQSLLIQYCNPISIDDINRINKLYSKDAFFDLKFIIHDLTLVTEGNLIKSDLDIKIAYTIAASTNWRQKVSLTEIFLTNNEEFVKKIVQYYLLIQKRKLNWTVAIALNQNEVLNIVRSDKTST